MASKKPRVPTTPAPAPKYRPTNQGGFTFTRRTAIALGAAAAAIVAVIAVVATSHSSHQPTPALAKTATQPTKGSDGILYGNPVDTGKLTGIRSTPAPWDNGTAELGARLNELGLPQMSMESFVMHIHQHLDIYVYGRKVTVPALIGINVAENYLDPVHTHTPDGVIHVESPSQRTFTLGQIFGVWGVRFSKTCLGSYCAGGGMELKVWSNGRLVTGDPTALALEEHEEIVVAFGTAAEMSSPVPSHYSFAAGL